MIKVEESESLQKNKNIKIKNGLSFEFFTLKSCLALKLDMRSFNLAVILLVYLDEAL